jgi:drug/metabolite transporter (DMT)-like permease
VLPLLIVGLVSVLAGQNPDRLKLPARSYWREPQYRAEALRRVRAHMWWLACLMTGLAIAIHFLLLDAQRSNPPHLAAGWFGLVVMGFLSGLLLWIAAFYLIFRPPRAEP